MVSPKIFNIVVDAVVRAVLLEVYGPQKSHHRFCWAAGEHCIVFYADDDKIVGRNPIWVQMIMTYTVRMFERVELQTNLGKTKLMLFTLGLIWGYQGTSSYMRRAKVEGARAEENQDKF